MAEIDYIESPYFFDMTDIITDYYPIFESDFPVVEQDNREHAPRFIDFTKAHTFTLFNPEVIRNLNYEHTEDDTGSVIHIRHWMFTLRRGD